MQLRHIYFYMVGIYMVEVEAESGSGLEISSTIFSLDHLLLMGI